MARDQYSRLRKVRKTIGLDILKLSMDIMEYKKTK